MAAATLRDPAPRRIDFLERPAVLSELERWLGVEGLAQTYPQAFHPLGAGQLIGVFDGDRLLSHAVTLDIQARTAAGTSVNAVLIGNVATAPHARGRGLATELLRSILGAAQSRGADAALLWSNKWDFYKRLGFAPAGVQLEAEIIARVDRVASRIRPALASDLPAIFDLHRAKPTRVERDLSALALMLSATPMQTLVLERAGAPVAYACYGKGLDFIGWWHEVGGQDSDVVELVRGAMTVLGQPSATLVLPHYRAGVRDALASDLQEERQGVVALRCPLTQRGAADLFVDGLDSI
ncbi:MAG: GNAT family N-acetyltransferase [Planctomycetota bacterium]